MQMGKSVGIALAGCALLAVAPVARADEDASLQDRIRDLEKTVLELKDQLGKQQSAEPLSSQVERYLQESEKGSLWTDMGGKPLGKAIDSAWLRMKLRFRPMWSKNLFDFTDGVDDEGFMTLFRHKLGLGARLHENLSCYIELDIDGTWGNDSSISGNDAGFVATPRMQQGYIDGLGAKWIGGNVKTRMGRWEMEYGDGYIIGDRDFTQAGLAFDGYRVSKNWEGSNFSADFIGCKLVDGYKNGLTATPDDAVYMFAIYGNYYGFEGKTGMPGGFEPYYILVKNQADVPGAAGKMRDIHTLGAYWYGDKATKDKGGFGWNINLDGQLNNDLFWATDSRIMYTMSQTKWTPKVFGQFAYASGDSDNPGGAGYAPLWQDGHARFGYSDLFGFTNFMCLGLGVHVMPQAGLTYGIEFRSDHIARNYTGGGEGKTLAWETDFVVKHKYSENVDIEAAYALVHWRNSRNTAGADDVQIAYVNVVLSF
jgi:hypothetical protein